MSTATLTAPGEMTEEAAPKKFITAEEFFEIADGRRCELIKGEIHYMTPAGGGHGATEIQVTIPLGQFVRERDLGEVFMAETGF